jgi:predicted dehydrogenase
MKAAGRLRIVLCGAGHWGPNIIRILLDDRRVELAAIVEVDGPRRTSLAERYPVPVTDSLDAWLADRSVSAVMIATPAATHAPLVRAALDRGKHVFVEKPMTLSAAESHQLCDVAAAAGLVLMVGHVFLFNRAFQEMQRLVADPAFGKLFYLYARRLNLGPVRSDVHAAWDLASHDVAMFLTIKQALPVQVTASGQAVIRRHVPDVVFANLFFADGTCGHIHASWLDPQKIRDVVAVGERQMVVFDDMSFQAPLRVYHHGFERLADDPEPSIVDTFGDFRVQLRHGEIVVPPISTGQPLATEIDEFITAVIAGRQVESDGRFGADVVAVLEAMDRSLAEGSRAVAVATAGGGKEDG